MSEKVLESWKTEDQVLEFELKENEDEELEVTVTDTDTNKDIILAVDTDNIDELIEILQKIKVALVRAEEDVDEEVEEEEVEEEVEEEEEEGK